MKKMTLKQALAQFHADTELSRCGLDGCPVGGWPETQQAKRAILEALPRREERSFTIHEFIAAAYTVDHADRYQAKEPQS